MAPTVARADLSKELNALDSVRPQMAKVDQLVSTPIKDLQFGMTAVVRDGLIRACGSLKAAAITMGMDQGQLTRELQSGAFKFERLEKLSKPEQSIVVERLHQEFGPLPTPAARGRQLTRNLRQVADELDQLLEHVK